MWSERTQAAMTAALALTLELLDSLVGTPALALHPELTGHWICVQRWQRAACILGTFGMTSRPALPAVRRNASSTSVQRRPGAQDACKASRWDYEKQSGRNGRGQIKWPTKAAEYAHPASKTDLRTFHFHLPWGRGVTMDESILDKSPLKRLGGLNK